MPRKQTSRPAKPITLAEHIARIAPLGGKARMESLTPEQRHELTQRAGELGGKARAKNLSAKRLREIARKAAVARWAKRAEADNGPRPSKR